MTAYWLVWWRWTGLGWVKFSSQAISEDDAKDWLTGANGMAPPGMLENAVPRPYAPEDEGAPWNVGKPTFYGVAQVWMLPDRLAPGGWRKVWEAKNWGPRNI